MDGESPKRAYDNSLREQQAQATRERILDAMAKDIAEHGFAEFSVARVAKRAGVSEPTIYRHFGGREALFVAFTEWFERVGRHPGFPASLAEVLETGVGGLFRYFEAHEPYIRASHTPKLAELYRPGREQRRERLAAALASATSGVDPARARRIQAVFGLLISSRAFLALKDEYQLSGEEAADAIDWAIRALAQHLEDEQP